jgi:hypothetical protein
MTPHSSGPRPGRTRGTTPAARTPRPCGSAASRRRRRRQKVGPLPSGQIQRLLRAPPVLLQRLALPGEHRNPFGFSAPRSARPPRPRPRDPASRRCCTRPSARRHPDPPASRSARGLHGHVQRTHDPRPFSGAAAVLLTERHQPRHLLLRQPDLLPTHSASERSFTLNRDATPWVTCLHPPDPSTQRTLRRFERTSKSYPPLRTDATKSAGPRASGSGGILTYRYPTNPTSLSQPSRT